VNVVKAVGTCHFDDLVRWGEPLSFAARPAVAAVRAPLAATASALRACPLARQHGIVDVLTVTVAKTHSAESDGESPFPGLGFRV
jgi:hypothetical protein